jgi:hypothetical protein
VDGYYFEVLEIIEDPSSIYEGGSKELLAVIELGKSTIPICSL